MPGPIGLADLLDRHEKVMVNGEEYIQLHGLSAMDCAELLKRYPPLEKVFLGRGISIEELKALAHDCIGGIIAAGLRKFGDVETESMANQLPLEMQADCIELIGRATFPSGFGPFAKRLAAAFGGLHSAPAGKPLDTRSAKASPPSSAPASPPNGSGPSLPASSQPTAS
jgi:hypothetical protein